MVTRDRCRRSSRGQGRNYQSWNVGRGILRLPGYMSQKHLYREQHPTHYTWTKCTRKRLKIRMLPFAHVPALLCASDVYCCTASKVGLGGKTVAGYWEEKGIYIFQEDYDSTHMIAS